MITMSMQGRTVLITGGNAGIGKETAVGLAALGANVVITSRDAGRGEAAVEEIRRRGGPQVTAMVLDLASFASIHGFVADFLGRFEQLHVLINNAGLILSERRETEEGFEMTFGVNHLGHFVLTDLLLERLKACAPARIINVSSRAHQRALTGLDFDDLQSTRGYRGLLVYARSKLANIYFTRELARRLEGTGVTANAVHPGLVSSRFALDGDVKGPIAWFYRVAKPLMRTARDGAETPIWAAHAPELAEVSGRFFGDCHEQRPSRVALDDGAARRLWEESEALVASAAFTSEAPRA